MEYVYDAWGTCTVTEDTSDCQIATINPYRYRGYYYDVEIGLYYLQSRYYNAGIGRFVGVDTAEVVAYPAESKAANLFNYCSNNPVNETDCSGLLLASKVAEIIVNEILGGCRKYEIAKIIKQCHGKKPLFRKKKLDIKGKYKVLGKKFEVAIKISQPVLEVIANLICN